MNILEKEFVKYSKPMFFHIGRVIMYLAALFILLGIFSRMNDSQFVFVNFFISLSVTILLVAFDVYIGVKKQKTYKNHKVQFFTDFVLFVDHRGSFKIPYSDITSYQLISNQITLRVPGNRFNISGRLHGINFDELKLMVSFLSDKGIQSKTGRGFIYFILLFLIINYGADYLFINVLKLSSDASLFGTLYICLILGVGYYSFEAISANKFLMKEE